MFAIWSFKSSHWCVWASYQIRNIACCACVGNAGNVFSRHRRQWKPLVSDPGMHHGTCVTHVRWCMSGSLNRGGGENVLGIPSACATRNFTYLARGPWICGFVCAAVCNSQWFTVSFFSSGSFNTLWLAQICHLFADDIKIFKLRLRFHWSLFLRFELTIFQH